MDQALQGPRQRLPPGLLLVDAPGESILFSPLYSPFRIASQPVRSSAWSPLALSPAVSCFILPHSNAQYVSLIARSAGADAQAVHLGDEHPDPAVPALSSLHGLLGTLHLGAAPGQPVYPS